MEIITRKIGKTQTNHRDSDNNTVKYTYEKPYLFIEKRILERLGENATILDDEAFNTTKELFELFISASKRSPEFREYFLKATSNEQKARIGKLGERIGIIC